MQCATVVQAEDCRENSRLPGKLATQWRHGHDAPRSKAGPVPHPVLTALSGFLRPAAAVSKSPDLRSPGCGAASSPARPEGPPQAQVALATEALTAAAVAQVRACCRQAPRQPRLAASQLCDVHLRLSH